MWVRLPPSPRITKHETILKTARLVTNWSQRKKPRLSPGAVFRLQARLKQVESTFRFVHESVKSVVDAPTT